MSPLFILLASVLKTTVIPQIDPAVAIHFLSAMVRAAFIQGLLYGLNRKDTIPIYTF